MRIKFANQNKFICDWIRLSGGYAEQHLGLNIPQAQRGNADIWLANHMERIPKKKPRQVKVADSFACPYELQAGWDNLKQKVESGQDIYPHVSRQIKKIDSLDPMLMHWSINHFHIGILPDPKHQGLIMGGSHIVYAHVDDNVFYAIALDKHGRWEDVDLVETIKRNWPENLHIRNELTISRKYSIEETLELRKNQINAPTILKDGGYYMGFGETLAGSSTLATMRVLPIRKLFGNAQHFLENNLQDHLYDFKIKEDEPVAAEIVLNGNLHFAVTLPDYHLNLDLEIPSIDKLVESLKG